MKHYFICHNLATLMSTDFCAERCQSDKKCVGCVQKESKNTIAYSQSNVDTRIHDTEFEDLVIKQEAENRSALIGFALHEGRMFATHNGVLGSI